MLIKERQREIKQKRKRKRRKRCIIFLGTVLVAATCFFSSRIVSIQVKGCHVLKEQEVRKEITSHWENQFTISLFLKQCFGKSIRFPFAQNVEIRWRSFNRIQVYVTEKPLLGYVSYMGHCFYLDQTGVVIASSVNKREKVPEIIGLQYKKLVLHERLELADPFIFSRLGALSKAIQKYKINVSEIRLTKEQEITLKSEKIEIQLGKQKEFEEVIGKAAIILPNIRNKNISGILDMKKTDQSTEEFYFYPNK